MFQHGRTHKMASGTHLVSYLPLLRSCGVRRRTCFACTAAVAADVYFEIPMFLLHNEGFLELTMVFSIIIW